MFPSHHTRCLRLLHSSARTSNLIGPPDPVSHLRPVIYDDVPCTPNRTTHPYSLSEFTGSDTKADCELQWKWHREQLDNFNQKFWFDSNTRFEAAKSAVLRDLPESCSDLDSERALSEFYKEWVKQEADRMDVYTSEYRRANLEGIKLATRVKYNRLMSRISSTLNRRT